MRLLLVVLAILSSSQVAFADIGPGPEKPDLRVEFVKDGAPYTGEVRALYRCWEELSADDGPMGQTDVDLSCSEGICTNDLWYYKFNPCFYPESGEILFEIEEGVPLKAEGELAFPEAETYLISVDIDSGTASIDESPAEPEPEGDSPATCPTGMILLAMTGVAAFSRAG